MTNRERLTEYNRQWREKNPDRVAEYNRRKRCGPAKKSKYYAKNRDKIRAQKRADYPNCRDKILVEQREYYRRNKDKIKARANVEARLQPGMTGCGDRSLIFATLDSNGSASIISNLQPLWKLDNLRKGSKHPAQFQAELI